MTAEKRKLIADAWCEAHACKVEPTGNPLADAFSLIGMKRGVWEKHGLIDDADLEEWLDNQEMYLSTSYPQ